MFFTHHAPTIYTMYSQLSIQKSITIVLWNVGLSYMVSVVLLIWLPALCGYTHMACCYTIGSYIGEVTCISPAMQVTVYLQSSHYANYTVFL